MDEYSDLREVIPPTAEPVSVALVKQHCRIGGDPEEVDDYESLNLPIYISAARHHAERVTGLILTDAVYELRLSGFWPGIVIPAGPVTEVVSITYIDDAGDVQTLDPASYVLDDHPWLPRVRRAYGTTWPTNRTEDGDKVVVRFRGPYGNVTDSPPRRPIPDDLKVAILLMTAHYHDNRASVDSAVLHEVPLGALHILQMHRRNMGV